MVVLTKLTSFVIAVILAITSLFSGIEGLFKRSPVAVLYTSDVHCAVDENIGYSGLAAYKKEISQKYENVTLVDCGDYVQGDLIGSVSSGEYIIDIMNNVGYDMVTLGNHEFDYGMPQLKKLMDKAEFDFLDCDITYSGTDENLLSGLLDYEVVDYGNVQVGFIGVSTPNSVVSSTPASFMDENGNFVYNFENVFESVQKSAVKARLHGADYVVVMSHLGDGGEFTPFSSIDLIESTRGIDVVLDGHSHSVIESRKVKNAEGKDVILSATGTKLENIGQLIIAGDGTITASLVSDYDKKDADTDSFIAAIKEKYEESLSAVVGSTDFALCINDENGIRMVRNRETSIGNLCADALRSVTGSDIAICNGGGIRANINKGSITNNDIIKVHPFSNAVCTVEVTGRQIADALEWTSRDTAKEYTNGTTAVGENGGFLQVSGLKYTIDTSVPTSVTMDENSMFSGITGERRVKNIEVLDGDGYVPLDMEKKYIVSGTNYVLLNKGDGMTAFNGCRVVADTGTVDNEILMFYIKNTMKGKIDAQYAQTEGRITVF